MDVLIVVTIAVIGVFVLALAAYLVVVARMLAKVRSAVSDIAETFERAEAPLAPLEEHLRGLNGGLVQLRNALQDLAGLPQEAGGRARTRAEVADRETGADQAARERGRTTGRRAASREGGR